jgi:hypothetical protein
MKKSIAILLFVAAVFALVACAPTGVGDPCEPEVLSQGGVEESETVIETSSLQCRTRVCMYFNRESFCTKRCHDDSDCLAEWWEEGPEGLDDDGEYEDEDWPPAWCEAEVSVGSPGVLGSYCVPQRASRDH